MFEPNNFIHLHKFLSIEQSPGNIEINLDYLLIFKL